MRKRRRGWRRRVLRKRLLHSEMMRWGGGSGDLHIDRCSRRGGGSHGKSTALVALVMGM